MANHVRREVGARVFERIANPGLRAEMDDSDEIGAGEARFERGRVGEIELLEAKALLRRELRQPVVLELRMGRGVEVVYPGAPFAARERGARDMKADEAGGAGDDD